MCVKEKIVYEQKYQENPIKTVDNYVLATLYPEREI